MSKAIDAYDGWGHFSCGCPVQWNGPLEEFTTPDGHRGLRLKKETGREVHLSSCPERN